MLWHPSAALLQLFLFRQLLVRESPVYITPLLASDRVNLRDLAFELSVSKHKFCDFYCSPFFFAPPFVCWGAKTLCKVSVKTPVLLQHHHHHCQCHQSHLTLNSHHRNSHHRDHCTGN